MKSLKHGGWAVLAATGALYLVMVLWSLPQIALEADGLRPFDMRPLGYSVAEAEMFNNALSAEGRVFYQQVQHRLDTVFPALLLVSFLWAGWRLFRGAARWGFAALALVETAADYAENAAVAQMLERFDPEVAQWANLCTLVKSGSVTVLSLVLIWALWHRLRRRIAR